MEKQDILSLSNQEIVAVCEQLGEKSFRAQQLLEWLWNKKARSFDELTNMSKQFREKLAEAYYFKTVTISNIQKSKDGTQKFVFRLGDGAHIEGVLIPSRERITACISSQVGCGLACEFCATGTMGFTRNLSVGEITDQLFAIEQVAIQELERPVTNVVYMGMGEPLQNYEHVMASIARITDVKGHAMAPSRITVSTAGISKFIKKLADDNFACNLAISLHFPDDERRTKYMPVNKANNLNSLSDALAYYHQKTKKRISIEYALLHGINDSIEDASLLAHFTKRFPVKINIIEYNSFHGSSFKPSKAKKQEAFVSFLQKLNLIVNIRHSKGKDIDAACGQLIKR